MNIFKVLMGVLRWVSVCYDEQFIIPVIDPHLHPISLFLSHLLTDCEYFYDIT